MASGQWEFKVSVYVNFIDEDDTERYDVMPTKEQLSVDSDVESWVKATVADIEGHTDTFEGMEVEITDMEVTF